MIEAYTESIEAYIHRVYQRPYIPRRPIPRIQSNTAESLTVNSVKREREDIDSTQRPDSVKHHSLIYSPTTEHNRSYIQN